MKKFFLSRRLINWIHKIQVMINPESEAKRCYRKVFGRDPDLKHPKDFIEKTYWLQLHTDTSMWTLCADKYRMREYVEKCELAFLLPELYGVWHNANDIDFNKLPNTFVLKTNNATETCLLVKNKKEHDLDSVRKTLNKWLGIKFGYSGVQLHYLKIEPLIIAEEYLLADKEQKEISPNSLIDYKIYCCNGVPECVWVAYNRTKEYGVDMNLYDMNWKSHPEWMVDMPHYHYKNTEIPKPEKFNDIIEYCKKLANPFPEVRIDFYVIGGKPYIGELTFTSGYGFFSPEFYLKLGEKVLI